MTRISSALTARIEVHPIPTQSLTDRQFLAGAKDGKPVTIAGELRVPTGSAPFPAVVLVHGSGGIGSNVGRWADAFLEHGIAAFVLDCFTGRGISSTINDQSQLENLTVIYDAYRALETLLKVSLIDPKRIALMGFSKGGFAALYASLHRFQRYYAPSGAEYAAYIPFYPRGDIRFDGDEDVSDRPIRLFHGEADDWIPVGPTRAYAERLQAAGHDIRMTTYPGARHSFDSPTYPESFTFPEAEVSTTCRLAEKNGVVANLDTGKPFTHQDACIRRGASVGYHAAATAQAREEVLSFLTGLFSPAKQ